MLVKELYLRGLLEIIPEPNFDHRGFFMRTYDSEILKKYSIDCCWVQENHSRTEKTGIIRGLHLQTAPFSETKMIRCIRGNIFDVAVDLRKDSETFGKWYGTEISEFNRKILLIPRGFAHGFCSLSDVSEVIYKVDNFYSPAHELGIIWNDNDLAIDWPVKNPVLSEKDKKNLTFEEYKKL